MSAAAAALSDSDYPAYAAHISNKAIKPLGWGARPALVLVDVAAPYFSPSSAVSLLGSSCGTADALPAHVAALVAAARAGGCPIAWANTQFAPSARLRDAALWPRKVAPALLEPFVGDEVQYLDGLVPDATLPSADAGAASGPGPDLVVTKPFVSAFYATNLATQLLMRGVDTVVLCGARTSGEIRQTALDAQGLGFRGMIVGAACADTCKETHFANLFDIRAKIGDVVTVDDAVVHLEKGRQ